MDGPYLAAIERAFFARAGRGLMLSAADLSLVEQWYRGGLPVEVVVDGLEAAFERAGDRTVRSLRFARRTVEAHERAWRARGVGAAPAVTAGPADVRPGDVVPRLRRALRAAAVGATPELARALSDVDAALSRLPEATPADALFDAWGGWVRALEAAAWASAPPEERRAVEAELEARLGPERRRVEPADFEATWNALRGRALRRRLGLPDATDLDAESW